MEGFHSAHGWWFKREDDGSVRVAYAPLVGVDEPGPIEQDVKFTASMWNSIVASVSAQGDTPVTYGTAHRLHWGLEVDA